MMSFFIKFLLLTIIGIAFLAYSPFLIEFEPKAYTVKEFSTLTGPAEVNNRLNEGERLFNGQLFGPESLAVHEGKIYTGTLDGCISQITGDKVKCVVKINKDCVDPKAFIPQECGRPLGLRFDQKGILYVADAYKGILAIDIKKGTVTPLLTNGEKVENKPITFPDDLDIDENGIIYFSDASTRWPLNYVVLSILEHENTGRIIKYDTKKKTASVLVDNLYFPNGVQLSKKKDSLLIAEFSQHRIVRYYLQGPKKGSSEVLIELPGVPDNIRASKNGYWIALNGFLNSSNPTLIDRMRSIPLLKKVIVRFQYSVGSVLKYAHQYWASPVLKHYAEHFQEAHIWFDHFSKHGMAVEIDENGNILQSIHSPDGQVKHLSEILEYNDNLYCGSFINPYLIKVKQKL